MAKTVMIEVANESIESLKKEIAKINENVTSLKLNLFKDALEEELSETNENDYEQ